ncbi:HNH endonuclease [Candidatus Aerophobetes bacterium]|uniref:HNH endonuclease n=1 Tax=Aerophobetes bacterium TaxID=2030807 RepID=A0A523WCX6_UNCAE|nr:HNH endonuclease [Candidatus Aerophobetes bacterium]TET64619.1 MAG: HNH endonuclease [Candidatus Aerophobetes bacterium]
MSVEVLSEHVLVLNGLWQAVDICSVKRAVCLLYLKHAQVVVKDGGSFYTFGFEDWRDFSRNTSNDNDIIRTISYNLKIPRIILLLLYDKLPPWEVKFTRKNIYKRDNNICQYCGKKFQPEDLNLDHILPSSRGGKDSWENVVCSCVPCNLRKANRTLKEAGMNLIRLPRKPAWRAFVKDSFTGVREESWKDFLDVAYWNVELEEDEE